jgi:hypothetical protein
MGEDRSPHRAEDAMINLAAVAVVFAAFAVNPTAPVMVSHSAPNALCSAPAPRDYTAPFARLPPIREIPLESKAHPGLGNLPFGPKGVELYASTNGQVLVGRSNIGFAVWSVGFLGNRPDERPNLDWSLTAQLVALDAAGQDVEEIDHARDHIGRIDDAYQPSVSLAAPADPGFYRADVQISEADGTVLGSYSEYFRVMEPTLKVRLGISNDRVRPGKRIAVRPENLGTDSLTYGEDYVVQRRESGHWRGYRPMNGGLWAAWLGFIQPGGAGSCNSPTIPPDTPPGRYRILKYVGASLDPKASRSVTLVAPFTVVSG